MAKQNSLYLNLSLETVLGGLAVVVRSEKRIRGSSISKVSPERLNYTYVGPLWRRDYLNILKYVSYLIKVLEPFIFGK